MTVIPPIGLCELCYPQAVARAVAKVAAAKHLPGPDGVTHRDLPAFWAAEGPSVIEALKTGCYQPGTVRLRLRDFQDGQETFDQNLHARVVSTLLLEGLYGAYSPYMRSNVLGFWRGQNPSTKARAVHEFARRLNPSSHIAVVSFRDFLEFEVRHDRLLAALAARFTNDVTTVIGRLLSAHVEGEPACEISAGLRPGETLTPAMTNAIMLGAKDSWAAGLGRPWLRYQSDYHVAFDQEEDAMTLAGPDLEMGEFCQATPRTLPVGHWWDEVPRNLHIPVKDWRRFEGPASP